MKKAVMGISTLIIFISAILVAAVSAGVILHTQSRLQSEALTTGSDARKSVGINLDVTSIKGTDANDGTVSQFEMKLRLGPSSEPINLEKTALTVIVSNSSTSYQYGGIGDHYFTNKRERTLQTLSNNTRSHTDFDNDLKEDYISVFEDTLQVNLTTEAAKNFSIPDISSPGAEFNNSVFSLPWGRIIINGNTTIAGQIGPETSISIESDNFAKGIYTVSYSIKAKKHVEDRLRYGDNIKMMFETHTKAGEEQDITFLVHTPEGVPLQKKESIPSVLTSKHITLFP